MIPRQMFDVLSRGTVTGMIQALPSLNVTPQWKQHLITLPCCSVWMWTGTSGMHGQWKQCDCLGCKIMGNSFSLFLYIDFYYCHCYTAALGGGGSWKYVISEEPEWNSIWLLEKSVYNYLPIWMQNKWPQRAREMAQLGKCLLFNDKGLGFISGYGHCAPIKPGMMAHTCHLSPEKVDTEFIGLTE